MRHNKLLRLLLLGLLFFPSIVQQAYLFAAHDHPVCDESTLHFHQIDTSCDLLDYIFTPHAVLNTLSFAFQDFSFENNPVSFVAIGYTTSLFSKQLRGPPVEA